MSEPTPGVRGETRTEELSRAQAGLARRVAEARATVPDVTLEADVDATALGADPLARVLHALARALRAHPRANGAYRDGHWEFHERVNVGLAVEHAGSVVVPVLRDADTLDVAALGAARTRLADRAAAGELTAADSAGATFTVWSAASAVVTRLTPVLTPGQAGALGVGGPAGPRRTLTLVADHRILWGAAAEAFLETLVAGLSVS